MKAWWWMLFLLLETSGQVPMTNESRLLEAGVSLELATQRKARISNLATRLHMEIPESLDQPVLGRVVHRFDLEQRTADLVLDFQALEDDVIHVSVVGRELEAVLTNEHVVIPAKELAPREVPVEIRIDFRAGELSLNRHANYLYTLLVPDRARTLFPCFDQPDLKAKYSLSLGLPPDWVATSAGKMTDKKEDRLLADRSQYSLTNRVTLFFSETPPLSPYQFSFAAGKFQVESLNIEDRIMRVYHLNPNAESVSRNLPVITNLHTESLRWMEDYTGLPYPYDSFDIVLLPAFQYAGMEHVGAILYRDQFLWLDENSSQEDRLWRAALIAHETSHAWFGNLVTMRWFNDVWLKEVFANFFAAQMVHPAFPNIDHELQFMLAHYPSAFAEDRSAGTHPIQQRLENLNRAGSMYGELVYKKSPILMRQLESLIGPETLRRGLQSYLRRYAHANANWDELIEQLDAETDRNLAIWSRAWIQTEGRPRIRVQPGELIVQADDDRPQRIQVAARIDRQWSTYPIDLRPGNHALPNGIDCLIPDVSGRGYADFVLSPPLIESLQATLAELPQPAWRGAAAILLWDDMVMGRSSPESLLQAFLNAIDAESSEQLREFYLSSISTMYWLYLTKDQQTRLTPQIDAQIGRLQKRATSPGEKLSLLMRRARLAVSESAIQRVRDIWKSGHMGGISIPEVKQITLLSELAARGSIDSADIEFQLARMTSADHKKRLTFITPALSNDPAVRQRFFERLRDSSQREHEPWVLDGLRALHHPLRADASRSLIHPALDLLEEIQKTGDIFFPKGWVTATLSGHRSAEAAAEVRAWLKANPALPNDLKRKVLQAADLLLRRPPESSE